MYQFASQPAAPRGMLSWRLPAQPPLKPCVTVARRSDFPRLVLANFNIAGTPALQGPATHKWSRRATSGYGW